MTPDLDKIADEVRKSFADVPTWRQFLRRAVDRIQREQKAVAWIENDLLCLLRRDKMAKGALFPYSANPNDSPLFTFPPATPSAIPGGVDWSKFPGWLIDHHEGDMLTEELLQRALSDMLSAAPAPAGEKGEQ